MFGNGQAQAGAAKAARGGVVSLLETLKQLRRLRLGQANAGVAHRTKQQHLVGRLFPDRDLNVNLAFGGELDGVVGVVDQNLAQAQGVANELLGH